MSASQKQIQPSPHMLMEGGVIFWNNLLFTNNKRYTAISKYVCRTDWRARPHYHLSLHQTV